MKKSIFLMALLCLFGTKILFAQTPSFTEQTVNEIHQAFIADPPKAVAERVLPSFKMIGNDGSIVEYTVFKSWNVSGAGLAEWPTSEVTVQQSGNLAIAKGISKHKPKNANTAFNQRFTETYEYQNGNWMLASAHYTDIQPKK